MQLWGGRFSGDTSQLTKQLNDSFGFDQRLYAADIQGSKAYAEALLKVGIITTDEHAAILSGLTKVLAEFDGGTFQPLPSDEDIHTAVERRLTEIIGAPAGKLHTGRSRNDQVATDLRLWLMGEIRRTQDHVKQIQAALVEQAEGHLDVVMPGYTHMQPAQPILYSHWLMSFFWMLQRDQERLGQAYQRTAVCPLGSGALAGNPFGIDRDKIAAELGMVGITMNSLDGVSDRDFVVDFLSAVSLMGVHLSRLAEDLILYTSPAYGFIAMGEEYTTGSSLMPQKRNPDVMELTRGKAARLIAAQVNLLITLKGLPSSYNKDLQEDKEPLFDAVDTLNVLLPVLVGVIQSLKPNDTRMCAALDPAMLATDLADYLVERGIPFREAHGLVGQAVRRAEQLATPLNQLAYEEYAAISSVFGEDVYSVFDFNQAVARRKAAGGTSPDAVTEQIQAARSLLGG